MSLTTPPPSAAESVSDGAPHHGGPDDVVVGADGSECALGAVRWAAREAARRGVALRIVHAAPYLGPPDSSGEPSPELPTARRIAAKAYTVALHTAPGVAASTEIVDADPAPALLAAAESCALIVLGSSTTGAPDEMVLAPVALRVSAHASCPVVVVPRLHGRPDPTRPVVAVLGMGDADDDEAVVAFAAEAARAAGVGLSLVETGTRHARPPGGAEDWQQRFPDLTLTTAALPGATPSQLLSAGSSAPLIVLSTGRDPGLHRSPDSAHRWLLRHCPFPLALIPAAPGRQEDAGASATTG